MQCGTAKEEDDVDYQQVEQTKLGEISGLMCQITDYLYLSGLEPSKNIELLHKKGITHVINLCGDVCGNAIEYGIQYMILRVKDTITESLSDIFYHCNSFIEQARYQNGKVLVHCHLGVSRSASVVIGYLMTCNNIEFIDAYAHTRSCRSIVSPNTGFIFQLIELYKARHFTLIRQLISAQCIKDRLKIRHLIKRSVALHKDVAVRDMIRSNFTQVHIRNIKGVVPNVYKLGTISDSQPRLLFRMDQTFWKKVLQKFDRNTGRKVVQPEVKYRMDSGGMYVVTQLPIGTVVIVGKSFQKNQNDNSVMMFTRQYQEMLTSKVGRALQKPDQYNIINENFDGYNCFKPQIESLLGELSEDLRKCLNLFLNEQLYFEYINRRMIVFYQEQVERDYSQYCDNPVFQYLMAKLYFFEAKVNSDWEQYVERERINAQRRPRAISGADIFESGFSLLKVCPVGGIFE